MTATLAQHWQLMLAAAVAGLALGVAVVAGSYLAPLVRLRLAADPEGRARVVMGEVELLRRLVDEAAVLEEHGLAGVQELRAEAKLRALLLRSALHRTQGRPGRRR